MAGEQDKEPSVPSSPQSPRPWSAGRKIAVATLGVLLTVLLVIMVLRQSGGGSDGPAEEIQQSLERHLIENPTGLELRLENEAILVPTEIVQEWFGTLAGAEKVTGIRAAYDVVYHLDSSWDWSRTSENKIRVLLPLPEISRVSLRPGSLTFEPGGVRLEALEESGLKQVSIQSLSVYLEQHEVSRTRERREVLRAKILEALEKGVPGAANHVLVSFPDESDSGAGEP